MESLKNEKVETSKTDFLSKLELNSVIQDKMHTIITVDSECVERLQRKRSYKEKCDVSPEIRHTIVDIDVPELELELNKHKYCNK